MKAVVYRGPNQVAVEDVPDPKIERQTDAIVKITSTSICGSDLHMYEGRTDFEQGRVFGHENLGVVQEVGPAVERLKPGDWVCLPFNVSCGHCKNCERGLSNYCLNANEPGMAGGAFGFADMGPWQGGQAEYLRVPWADFMCLKRRSRRTCHRCSSALMKPGIHPRFCRFDSQRPRIVCILSGPGNHDTRCPQSYNLRLRPRGMRDVST